LNNWNKTKRNRKKNEDESTYFQKRETQEKVRMLVFLKENDVRDERKVSHTLINIVRAIERGRSGKFLIERKVESFL